MPVYTGQVFPFPEVTGGTSGVTVSTALLSIENSAVATSGLVEVNPVNVEFDGSADEQSFTVAIGFPVQFFGISYNEVYINSNSYFTFGGTGTEYGESTYEDWINLLPFPGVFIGSDDGSVQKITSTGAIGTAGSRTNTIRFQGSVDYSNNDPLLSDVFWEITFHEDEPSKIYLNIIQFNANGGVEGTDFFSFSSFGMVGEPYSYDSFDPSTGNQYVITLAQNSTLTDYTGSKLVILDNPVSISENLPQDSVDIEFGFVKSDITVSPSFGKVSNIVTLTQVDYDGLSPYDPETLYVIVG